MKGARSSADPQPQRRAPAYRDRCRKIAERRPALTRAIYAEEELHIGIWLAPRKRPSAKRSGAP